MKRWESARASQGMDRALSGIDKLAESVEDVVSRSAVGDREAFAILVARHTAEMARVAFIICGDIEMARDAVQSAWQEAWTKLPGLRRPTSIRPWLLAVAANEARQIARRERRRRSVEPGALTIGVDTVQPDDDFALRRALDALPVEDRRLLAMRYGAGLTSEEIGRQLGISASGTRVRLMRLLTRLREELRDDGP